MLNPSRLEDALYGSRSVSFFTRSENLSAPDARDSSARLALLAAAAPKAATSFRPELKAAMAIFSAALITSSVSGCLLRDEPVFLDEFLPVDFLAVPVRFGNYSRIIIVIWSI